MYYLQSRYYNPEWGRFINADAIAGRMGELLGHNIFVYCKNDPINWSDKTGLRRERADDGGTTSENSASSGSYETTVSDELEMTLQNETTEMRLASMNSLEEGSNAYRYVSEGELNVIKKIGKVPNTDRAGNPKSVYVSPNEYDSVTDAEEGLQIGQQNPFGPTESPAYRLEFKMNAVKYRYGGNVEGGTGVELITDDSIPIDLSKIVKLK